MARPAEYEDDAEWYDAMSDKLYEHDSLCETCKNHLRCDVGAKIYREYRLAMLADEMHL